MWKSSWIIFGLKLLWSDLNESLSCIILSFKRAQVTIRKIFCSYFPPARAYLRLLIDQFFLFRCKLNCVISSREFTDLSHFCNFPISPFVTWIGKIFKQKLYIKRLRIFLIIIKNPLRAALFPQILQTSNFLGSYVLISNTIYYSINFHERYVAYFRHLGANLLLSCFDMQLIVRKM